MNKKLILVLGLSFVLTACGNKAENTKTNTATENKTNSTVVENKTDGESKATEEVVKYEDIKVTPEDASKIFRDNYKGVKLKDISLDNEYDSYVYKVSGATETEEYEIKIHPVTSEIVKEKIEKDNEFIDDFEILSEDLAKINPLVEKALADAGEGYTLYEWDIEVDDGRKELNIELKDKSGKDVEYKYNVETEELIEKDK